MKLSKVRVQNYRSVVDSGYFDLESEKSILVGPNEAGKTALLQAIQHINPPTGVKPLSPLRDYPRANYSQITKGEVDPSNVPVVEAVFELEPSDAALLPTYLQSAKYKRIRYLDNSATHTLVGATERPTFDSLKKDLLRLGAHASAKYVAPEGKEPEPPNKKLSDLLIAFRPEALVQGTLATKLGAWLDETYPLIDESNEDEEKRFDRLKFSVGIAADRSEAAAILQKRMPIFILFNNYFRVKPVIHLQQLAERIANGTLDEERYDYGNKCLLDILGFEAAELSELGRVADPKASDAGAIEAYREKLDNRQYQLNAASVNLTREIRSIWNPDEQKGEAAKLSVRADAQYLKVIVEDDMGVEVELDQRSEGFQWLVSFFIVFFAESQGEHKNAILLLDEPGMSLHALKQREFRKTLSRLSKLNQTIYTTHSPFLVGPDELDLVRVVEMANRTDGTKVHTTVTANDPAALLPLQEALGYDLAQSLFTQKQNLILEGLTDYWYVDAVSQLLREAGEVSLGEKVALVPANSAGKVVYFATILHAQNLKVAALLDSDSAGEHAAKQESLVHTLGHKRILRTKDFLSTEIKGSEVEDLLRLTLVEVAKSELGWDVSHIASTQTSRSIVSIFEAEVGGFSKYRLAKAFVKWSRDHTAADLTSIERKAWVDLIKAVNSALK